MSRMSWTPELIAQLRGRIEVDGLTIQEAADSYFVCQGAIASVCRRFAIKSVRGPGGWHGSNQYVKAASRTIGHGAAKDPFGAP